MRILVSAVLLTAVVAGLAPLQSARAATVWSGYELSFSKPDGVDPLSPQWQDPITARVAITRVNQGGGLINVRSESAYDKSTSPAGTLWAFPYSNPSQVVSAANWAQLNFLPWAAAIGANGAGGPSGTIGQPSVVYLIDDDLYVDVRLTGWTIRTGGGFSYQRASGPAPGDYNADGFVDGADLGVWMAELDAGSSLAADGDVNGVVDGNDFLIWQRQFGYGPPAIAAAATSVPEPTSFAIVMALAAFRATMLHRLVGNRRHYRDEI